MSAPSDESQSLEPDPLDLRLLSELLLLLPLFCRRTDMLRYLLAEKLFSEIVAYEHRDSVGGTWNYTPLSPVARPSLLNGDVKESSDQIALNVVTNRLRELNTPMYDGLESNLPHMLMQFSDKTFSENTQLFPSRETVMKYLEDYANDIKPMIKFGHEVKYVKPITVGSNIQWEILVKSSSSYRVEKFDAVVVANGHCATPLLPDIEGLEIWCRKLPDSLHHSVSYKNPESFKNKVSQTFKSLIPLLT